MAQSKLNLLVVARNGETCDWLAGLVRMGGGEHWLVQRIAGFASSRAAIDGAEPEAIVAALDAREPVDTAHLQRLCAETARAAVVAVCDVDDEDAQMRVYRAGAQRLLPRATLTARGLVDSIRHAVAQRHARLSPASGDPNSHLAIDSAQLAAAVEAIGEMVVVTASDGTIRYVNPAFTRVTGYVPSEVIGKNPRVLKSGEHGHDFYREFWNTILGGSTWEGTIINRAKDGREFREEATVSPIRDASGRIASFVKVARDITDRLVMEEQLRQSSKMEAVGRLAGGIAHDFNNLLTVIQGYTELLQYRAGADTQGAGPLSEVIEASRKAAELTHRLLAFSRKTVAKDRVLNLNTSLASLEGMFSRILGEDVELNIHMHPSLWNVNVDPGHIEQVLFNLVSNARDAMANGGRLTISTENVEIAGQPNGHVMVDLPPGRYVVVSVGDTGHGMDAATRARLFEPFFSTKGEEGTGLGLATSYGIVKQHKGHILCHSEPGQGTTFTAYLPAVDTPVESDRGPTGLSNLEGGGETVLMVEDDPSISRMTSALLGQLGYRVLVANTGLDGLEAASRHTGPIQLLFTDLVLPDITGREVADRLREVRPDVHVLYASGYSDDVIFQRGIVPPGTAFLKKPYRLAELTAAVRDALVSSPG